MLIQVPSTQQNIQKHRPNPGHIRPNFIELIEKKNKLQNPGPSIRIYTQIENLKMKFVFGLVSINIP